MFRGPNTSGWALSCFPRIRGDVPPGQKPKTKRFRFSPHTRGCSLVHPHLKVRCDVFPAYAGMFLSRLGFKLAKRGFPRIRGDVPRAFVAKLRGQKFSPHTRGCSEHWRYLHRFSCVFPAYAGMFRFMAYTKLRKARFPRIRGDVPVNVTWHAINREFSPHTRGCSGVVEVLWLT